MTDGMEAELAKLFEDSRAESDNYQLVRMAARAVEVVAPGGAGMPRGAVGWLAGLALCGFVCVLVAPAPSQRALPRDEAIAE